MIDPGFPFGRRNLLFLVAWEPGSAVAQLELGEPPAQMRMFGYIGEESMQTFVCGITEIAHLQTDAPRLPNGFDRGVLQAFDALANVLDHGIDTITFAAKNGETIATCTLDLSLRDRMQTLLGQTVDVADTAKTGRLEELNGHGTLTGRLWEPDETKWLCHFKEEHIEQLPDAWMRAVRMIGHAIVEEGKERIFKLKILSCSELKWRLMRRRHQCLSGSRYRWKSSRNSRGFLRSPI